MKEIEIDNAGPIKKFRFSVPEEGGVVELLGYNGVGKTHALNAVKAWSEQRGSVPARDGQSAAEIEGFGDGFDGVFARFSRRSTFSGELEVELLSGKYDIGDIIDPGFNDPKANDARRIRALIQLSTGEETAKAELFHELLDSKEDFDREISLKAQSETDVVSMAAQIKRDLEAASRRDDELAEKARLKVEAVKAAIAGIDLSAPAKEVELAQQHENAIRVHAKLEADSTNAKAVVERSATAQEQLTKAISAAGGKTLGEIQIERDNTEMELNSLEKEKVELEQKLSQLKLSIVAKKSELKVRQQSVTQAETNDRLIASWQADITAAKEVKQVDEAELAAAALAVDEAQKAMLHGAIVRRAQEQMADIEETRKIARELKRKAEKLRIASHGTDGVLSKIVQQLDCPLKVSRGRLVTETARGEEVLDDLSDGQRVRLIIPIAVNAVKKPGRSGLIVIGQRFWQDLNPANRLLVAELVQGTGVAVVTARATDDLELRAELLEVEPALPVD